jgi:hypothetical protein
VSPTTTRIGQWFLSLLAGLVVSIIIHFMLFRIGIPLKPFIYVVF